MTAQTPTRSQVARWLVPSGILTLIALGVLWAVRPEWGYCIDGTRSVCQGGNSDWIAIAGGIGMIVAYAALTVVAFTMTSVRRTLVLSILTGLVGVVFLVALAASLSPGAPIPL